MSITVEAIEPSARHELALADERVELSWNDLDPLLNRAANALRALGGNRVAVFAPNSAETVIAYVACLEAGISSVPVSFHLTPGEVAYILSDSGAGAVLVGPETAETGIAAAREAGIATVIGWRTEPREGLISWEEWLAAASDAAPPADIRPLPHLHYTSGTTGRPKATETPPSYFPPADSVAQFGEIMRARRTPSPGVAVGPLYHTGPLGMARNLFAGGSLVVMGHFDAEKLLANIERYRIKASVMVPTHFQRLLALPDEVRAKYDVSSMQRLAHTGAACPRAAKKAMIEWFGPVIVEAYGGTEAGSTTFITSPEWLERPGSVGKALPPFETVIVGEDGSELPSGEVGQIYFRDTTGRGIVYRNDPDKTAAAHISPGVFTLGEMGYVDAEGYLFITDRVSDMIVSGGVNIYPAEAEHVLLRHPEVEDVAIVGAPNSEMGEEAKALVVPRDSANPPSAEELNIFCRESLAGFKCPRSYEFVPDIGRNAMGKVNKRALRQRFWPSDRTIGG
ncbi:AMP-binding protein [Sandaracinobacter sp. RS1-74]|uniref:AMP-binding protein n=1 Tax=Sandaracinobacteroides sayramensis TaxID=2913411 RepID=UPI001EDC81B6|nr:AMP-binding protein [Sandaracinobacteroides sayramensis]MCG2841134.1 AMP-binding protein [Sandaracinobacteroides sayramensis]